MNRQNRQNSRHPFKAMHGIRCAALLLAAFLARGFGLVGDWHAWTYLQDVTCLEEHDGFLYAGTSGGIRKLNPLTYDEEIFNNPYEGILDVEIAALTTAPGNRLFAASRNGFLYELTGPGQWRTIDRGYNRQGWKINKRAILSRQNYLILGTSKGLSILELDKDGNEKVAANLVQFDKVKNTSVTALFALDSLLYIGTPEGLFKATVYWDNIAAPPEPFTRAHGSLFNPQSWHPIPTALDSAADSVSTIRHISFLDGRLDVYNEGSTLYEPFVIRAAPGTPLLVKTKRYKGITGMETAAAAGNRIFLGSPAGLHLLADGAANHIHSPLSLFKGQVANVQASPWGPHFWLLYRDGNIYFNKILRYGKEWKETALFVPEDVEPFKFHMQTFVVTGPDQYFLGTWGFGQYYFKNGGWKWRRNDNSCLQGTVAAPVYVITRAAGAFRDQGIFTGQYHLGRHYTLAYFNTTTDQVTCFDESRIPSKADHPFSINVLNDSVMAVSNNHGIHLFEILSPDDVYDIRTLRTTAPSEVNTEIYAVELDDFGRLWAAGAAVTYYSDHYLETEPGNDSLTALDPLAGKECYTLRKDGAGHIWMGCKSGLIEITPGETEPLSKIRYYQTRDGLLDDEITHFDIDRKTGNVWVATKNGINLYESGGKTPAADLNAVKVFPNPFKPNHARVIFSELPLSSEVYIFSESGHMVFRAGPETIRGGEIWWNGKNMHGNPVKAGIYFYSVKYSGGGTKGKIIVAR